MTVRGRGDKGCNKPKQTKATVKKRSVVLVEKTVVQKKKGEKMYLGCSLQGARVARKSYGERREGV